MTHIWKIDNVERLTESGLITRIDYSCSTEHSGHTESHHGELELEGDITATDFIAYEDLTELQILENGNILKAINGGEINTKNNEIVIRADNFEYNKLTTLLKAKGNVRLIDKIADIIIDND